MTILIPVPAAPVVPCQAPRLANPYCETPPRFGSGAERYAWTIEQAAIRLSARPWLSAMKAYRNVAARAFGIRTDFTFPPQAAVELQARMLCQRFALAPEVARTVAGLAFAAEGRP
jgi:hypothetical protein